MSILYSDGSITIYNVDANPNQMLIEISNITTVRDLDLAELSNYLKKNNSKPNSTTSSTHSTHSTQSVKSIFTPEKITKFNRECVGLSRKSKFRR